MLCDHNKGGFLEEVFILIIVGIRQSNCTFVCLCKIFLSCYLCEYLCDNSFNTFLLIFFIYFCVVSVLLLTIMWYIYIESLTFI